MTPLGQNKYLTIPFIKLLLLLLLPQFSFHLVAVILTLAQTNQTRYKIFINETIQKHSTHNTKHSKYKYTYSTHYSKHPHN